jgi:beta-lactamase class A
MRWPLVILLLIPALRAETLDEQVRAATSRFQGTVSLYAKNLRTGATFGIHADDKVRTASTIKLGVLAATFAAVAEGRAKWTDFSVLHESDKIPGSGVLTEFSDGVRLTLSDLTHFMIVVSDNTATNLVLDHVPAEYVNQQMDKLGLPATRAMRKLTGPKGASGISTAGSDPANARFGLGSSTPREMATLLEKMETGQVVSPEASKEMIKILLRQQDHNGIARRMGGMQVANKAGALDQLRSDVGVVYSPRGKIVMAITCDDMPKIDWTSDNLGLLMIAKIAEILVKSL